MAPHPSAPALPRAPHIGIVVTDAYDDEDPDVDTPLLLEALAARGARAARVVWHDETVDLTQFDLLVIRSPWDYPVRLTQFQAWLEHATRSAPVVNSPSTMRWNLDKRYLEDLRRAGIPVVPTVYADSPDAVAAAIAGHGRVVVKPAVSAGARDTGLFEASDPLAVALAARIIAGGGVAMIQPEVPELSAGREKALYAIDGMFTHAIAKGALLAPGGAFIGGVYRENPVLVGTTEAERDFAARVLRAVGEVTGDPVPLYARVDTIESAAYGLCVLEVELIEPALNLHVAPHATGEVVDGILRAAVAATK